MKAFACLVRQTPTAWIVSIGDAQPLVLTSADTKPTELAQAVSDYLDGAKPKFGECHDKIVLCPESRATLFATSSIPAALKTRDRLQLKFHAESLLPLDAEQMAADFVLTAKELRVMAIDREEWQPIMDAFAAHNLHFRWIAPASVLAIEEAKRSIGDTARAVIWEEEGICELWQLDAAGIAGWTHLADASDDRLLPMRLFAAQAAGVRTWTAINCSTTTLAQLTQLDGIDVRSIELQPQATFAAAAADRLCRTTFEAWFDLRDGSLAGRDRYRVLYGWMQIAAAAVAGLLLVTSAACLWKSMQANRQLALIQEAHEKLFKATFPGNDLPPLVSKVIANEHQRIQGERNGKGELDPVPSALKLLHSMLIALTGDGSIRVRTRQIEIVGGTLELELTFDKYKDAESIAKKFEEVGFETGPANIREKDGKVISTFIGTLKSQGIPDQSTPSTTTENDPTRGISLPLRTNPASPSLPTSLLLRNGGALIPYLKPFATSSRLVSLAPLAPSSARGAGGDLIKNLRFLEPQALAAFETAAFETAVFSNAASACGSIFISPGRGEGNSGRVI